nr:glutamate synthase central domain-containing protein [Verrucomicrobium spinosum]
MALLFGFGASAVCPYLAFETVQEVLEKDKTARKPILEGFDFAKALTYYRKGLEKGVLKIMSKMGISVLSSYTGARSSRPSAWQGAHGQVLHRLPIPDRRHRLQ